MKNIGAVRRIDELGRIVLSSEIRQALDWNENTPLEICINANDSEVIIKKHHITCAYCNETEKLKEYSKQFICPACQKEIAKL